MQLEQAIRPVGRRAYQANLVQMRRVRRRINS